MTIFMAPFMSCGARLPVYALFCAALFGSFSGLAVFLIYLTGLAMAIFTGFMLKNTLFRESSSHFVMDLPHYHLPRPGAVLKSGWLRTKNFIRKAGKIVVTAVFILSLLNSVGVQDGHLTFAEENSQHSILALAGKSMAPIFAPMGISRENWPASVALFTGLFAKEAIVGTINSLYATMDSAPLPAPDEAFEPLDIGATVVAAFTSIGEGFVGLISSVDLLGISLITEDRENIAGEIGADTAVLQYIAAHFTVFSAFAYLLFVLMYFPCLAVIGAARQEMGGMYTAVMATYSTLLAWSVATLFYQVTEGHNPLYIAASILVLLVIYGGLHVIGWRETSAKSPAFAPPMRRNCCN